jgi:hypothetical protein
MFAMMFTRPQSFHTQPTRRRAFFSRADMFSSRASVSSLSCLLCCLTQSCSHWFYEDFIREENPKFPSLPLKKFSAMLFHACPLLRQWSNDHEHAFNTFMQYKTRVPVCGAIMLNEAWDKVLNEFIFL